MPCTKVKREKGPYLTLIDTFVEPFGLGIHSKRFGVVQFEPSNTALLHSHPCKR